MVILCQDQRLKDLDHRSKITNVIFYMSKDPDHFNDLDLLAKRSPIFPIYVQKQCCKSLSSKNGEVDHSHFVHGAGSWCRHRPGESS